MITFVLRKINKLFAYRAEQITRRDFYFSKIYFNRITVLYNTFSTHKANGGIDSTSQVLNPMGLNFGMTYKQVVEKFRKPSFIYKNHKKGIDHKALLIRHTTGNINLLMQLQFLNDKLFFIGLDVSRSIKKETEKTQIINTVIEKYLDKPYNTGDKFPVIEDINGNFIVINDDINFAICYLDGNRPEITQFLLNNAPVSKQTKREKESLFYAF